MSLKCPESVGVVAEYLNPSFLVKKSGTGFRLVTAFADVGRYSKPQPSLMPDVDSTLRSIARWKYIVSTDLTSAFYQIPLNKASMKYCGVVTPFRGVRVYTRCAMGMSGSETALEELMCRILGDLTIEGVVAKLADDLYVGGNTPSELLHNWSRVLKCLKDNGISLSPRKTFVAPKTASILGWIWSEGTLAATPHKVAALISCDLPNTVKDMRSFVGAYKVLSRVIPQCAFYLKELENSIAGLQSSDKVSWNEELKQMFMKARNALSHRKAITLPRLGDHLWIVTDGASVGTGLGATLYISRDGKLKIAGFFSAKLRKPQSGWLPCEVEALSIAAAVKHFSPFIVQCKFTASLLTDSKPCVQAFEKLCRGEYSASPRVATFLATVTRYKISVRHVAGAANLVSDFSSRNAPDCNNKACQVCSFISELDQCVVKSARVENVLVGRMPYASRAAWKQNQLECSDLRRVKAHLTQGTRPSKKLTNIGDIKRYLQVVKIANDGLLIVNHTEPLQGVRERIVIPKQLLSGLLTALHIKLEHPSQHQLKKITKRYFYGLSMDDEITNVSQACHLCQSLRKVDHVIDPQSTESLPDGIGMVFAADVVRRFQQNILVVRECITSFTAAAIISDERSDSLREGLLNLCVGLRSCGDKTSVIRVDSAPGFIGLRQDQVMARQGIHLDVGEPKNINKNPVAEKAIQELINEIRINQPGGGQISTTTLALAVASVNSRIRTGGLSAKELWTQRDQFTGCQLPISDQNLIIEKEKTRKSNHAPSEKSKCPSLRKLKPCILNVGNLVYLNSEGQKLKARDRYIVTSADHDYVNVKKFTGDQLRTKSYRVKRSDCYTVPSGVPQPSGGVLRLEDSDDDSVYVSDIEPEIPEAISRPCTEGASGSGEHLCRPVRQRNKPDYYGNPVLY